VLAQSHACVSCVFLDTHEHRNVRDIVSIAEPGDEEGVQNMMGPEKAFRSTYSTTVRHEASCSRFMSGTGPQTIEDFEAYISDVEFPAINPHTREAERHRFIRFSFGKRRT